MELVNTSLIDAPVPSGWALLVIPAGSFLVQLNEEPTVALVIA